MIFRIGHKQVSEPWHLIQIRAKARFCYENINAIIIWNNI